MKAFALLEVTSHGSDEIPANLQEGEGPIPGLWVHIQGTDTDGNKVNYWSCATSKDSESGIDCLSGIGRRVVDAAVGI